MYQLCIYIPSSHLDEVKTALFEAGAGQLGHYDHCCWQTLGEGQFRPLPNSHPHFGQENKLALIEEYKVEMMCSEEHLNDALNALHLAHPYEVPAYTVIKQHLRTE